MYVFAAFGGHWPGVAFLILALKRQLGTWGPIPHGNGRHLTCQGLGAL